MSYDIDTSFIEKGIEKSFADIKKTQQQNQMNQLRHLQQKSQFHGYALKIHMYSGIDHITVQYINEVALGISMILSFKQQGFISLTDKLEINPEYIYNIEIQYELTDDYTHYIPSNGMDYLVILGYTSDKLILSETIINQVLAHDKRTTLLDDDDL